MDNTEILNKMIEGVYSTTFHAMSKLPYFGSQLKVVSNEGKEFGYNDDFITELFTFGFVTKATIMGALGVTVYEPIILKRAGINTDRFQITEFVDRTYSSHLPILKNLNEKEMDLFRKAFTETMEEVETKFNVKFTSL